MPKSLTAKAVLPSAAEKMDQHLDVWMAFFEALFALEASLPAEP